MAKKSGPMPPAEESTSPSPDTRFGAVHSNPFGRPPKGSVRIGRPPSIVRKASRLGYYKRIPMLRDIADGLISVPQTYVTPLGEKIKVRVFPSIAERIRAIEVLGKFGGLTSVSFQDSDGEDVTPMTTGAPDPRRLSTEELIQLEKLLTRMSGAPEGPVVMTTDTGAEVRQLPAATP